MPVDLVAGRIWRRVLGTYECGRKGPTMLVIAGMHGNEPAGVLAVQRVLGRLQELAIPIAGRVVALAGNLGGLAAGKRFVARDLNRGWGEDAVARLLLASGGEAEDVEQRELLAEFVRVHASRSGPMVVLDLHSSSAGGAPFLCLADTIDNRRLGLATGVPIILGIEETLDGTSLEWFADRGIAGVAVEGGQHDDPATVKNHEAVLWRMLHHLRMTPKGCVDLEEQSARLASARRGVPAIVEIVRRHAITPADAFRMAPGFTNFAPVARGTLLATDRRGEIRAAAPCRVLLPLYQALGDDGFFLARTVRPFWLRLAAVARRLRLDALVTVLPGVQRDPADPRTILVDPRVARWFVTEIFHVLGFRKERRRGDRLAFTRRLSLPENARLGR